MPCDDHVCCESSVCKKERDDVQKLKEVEDSVFGVVDVSGEATIEEIVLSKCCIEVPDNICIQHFFQTDDDDDDDDNFTYNYVHLCLRWPNNK